MSQLHRTSRWRAAALALSIALVPALGACSSDSGLNPNKISVNGGDAEDTNEHEVLVRSHATEAEVAVGQRLVIDFGVYNPTVGDDYEVAQEPDATILANFQSESEYLGEKDEDGAPSTLRYTADAIAPGTTELKIDYYYRGDKSNKSPDMHMTVHVVEP